MKLKKIILSGLALCLIFNNTSLSLANMVSEDGRYETFKGNSITINDVLEEGNVDVEIEDNTLVNINTKKMYRYSTHLDNNGSYTKNENVNEVTANITQDITSWNYVEAGTLKPKMLKPNTQYTVIFEKSIGVNYVRFQAHDGTEYFSDKNSVKNGKTLLQTYSDVSNIQDISVYCYVKTAEGSNIHVKNAMVIEGNHLDKDIKYFEDMKSVGELENDKIKVLCTNALDGYNYYRETNGIMLPNGTTNTFDGNTYTARIGKIVVDSSHHFKPHPIQNSVDTYRYYIMLDNANINKLGNLSTGKIVENSLGDSLPWEFNDLDKVHYKIGDAPNTLFLYIPMEYKDNPNKYFEENPFTLYYEYTSPKTIIIDKKEILLSEPIRSLPNGIKDKIVRKNGQWVVERNIGEIIFNGDENWIKYTRGNNDEYSSYHVQLPIGDNYKQSEQIWSQGQVLRGLSDKLNCIGDKLWYDTVNEEGFAQGYQKSADSNQWIICVKKSRLDIDNVNGFKNWLSNSPITIIYELVTPVYEPLNIDSTLNTYLETTHISNNSNIPANMKVTIDRTINRATEAIQIAKENPTIENISQARYWANLMKETIKKDEINNQINDITTPVDLNIEKKTASANIDVYVKSDNSLSMTLSTNSITFDKYTGTDDIEKNNALEITVHSSLPYDLNAYLEENIQNSDKSVVMDSNLLQIKESNEVDYKSFINTKDKIVLTENNSYGNYKKYNIDLKIEGSNAYKADIYKTTIKFEAEQK